MMVAVTDGAGHNGIVERMSREELQGYLASRFQDHLTSGRFPDEEAVIAKVNDEAAVFDGEGSWLTYCSCGWRGNNPYPSREGARSSLTKHYEQRGAAKAVRANG